MQPKSVRSLLDGPHCAPDPAEFTSLEVPEPNQWSAAYQVYMKAKPIGLFILLASSIFSAAAQDDSRLEVFAGYAHQRGDSLAASRDGWVVSETAYIRPWAGIEVELSEMYGEYDQPPFANRSGGTGLEDNRRSYLAGPRFRLVRTDAFTLGAHALFGVTQTDFEGNAFFEQNPIPIRLRAKSTDFAGVIGPALDTHLTKRFSWRLQPDWAFRSTHWTRSSLRLATGPVFRFGL